VTRCSLSSCVFTKSICVFTRLVVSQDVSTVDVALGSNRVPLADQLSLVSILAQRLTHGDANFLKSIFIELHHTPLPMAGIDTLALLLVSHIFCTFTDSTIVTIGSAHSDSHFTTVSHNGYVPLSTIHSLKVQSMIASSICPRFTASVAFTATGTIGDFKNVFISSISSSPVRWTTSASSALSVSSLTTSSCMSLTCSAVVTSDTVSPTSKL